MFHNIVANKIYTTKQARPDTFTVEDLIPTRVREPNKDDWGKIINIMKYIRGERYLTLILSANGSGVLKQWIDAGLP